MGARGPQPKPTRLKLAAGNPGKRTLNDGEPIPPALEVIAPTWLSKDGKRIWATIAPMHVEMKTLTCADVIPFARYCEYMARFLKVKKLIEAGGTSYTKKDDAGHIVYVGEIPQAAEFRKLGEILVRLEDRFGMSPAARSRINVDGFSGPARADTAGGANSLEHRRHEFWARARA